MPELLSGHLRRDLDNEFADEWARQRRTAEDILQRLQQQEGVVLADQVGMGKTYVALAVAVTSILQPAESKWGLGQVVIFVPARVADKWVAEWNKFCDLYLVDAPTIRVSEAIRSGDAFLKVLDDPPARRKHVIVVTHEALTASLRDSFMHLALVYYAVRNRRGADVVRLRIARWSRPGKRLLPDTQLTPELVEALLKTPPEDWRDLWSRLTGFELDDDPVPAALRATVQNLNLESIWNVLAALPARESAQVSTRLKRARASLNDATQAVWKQVLVEAKLNLPLLVVDEAHALKNDWTRISRLFTPMAGESDDGAFHGVFNRILMVTATPFELGHSELINVLRRLDAIRPIKPAPAVPLSDRLEELKGALQRAHETALALDDSWSRLRTVEDVAAFDEWTPDAQPSPNSHSDVRAAWIDAQRAARARQAMHRAIKPWVIRHERPRRRDYLVGRAIIPDSDARTTVGLDVGDEVALPFLLAARAQALATDDRHGVARPLFAYGIASSFEAFLRLGDTVRTIDTDIEDDRDADESTSNQGSSAIQWYSEQVAARLAESSRRDQHPKIAATVQRATSLWLAGQKCLIFCWYIRTTAALEGAIQNALEGVIRDRASVALGVDGLESDAALDRLAERLLRIDSQGHTSVWEHLEGVFRVALGTKVTVEDIDVAGALTRSAIRNLRTPAYLVRFTRLSDTLTANDLLSGIAGDNELGFDVVERWRLYAQRVSKMAPSEVKELVRALQGEQSGEADDENFGRGASLAQVRRAYGGTRREDRQRLTKLFNTPFAPDILVASSVMGEGIDLHHECRHVIHHDLDWNPGKLEQRTGRLDRIGALAEREGNIQVFEPFLAGTHDEKMFRVVKDRAGWFDIVMGRAVSSDEGLTDAEENRYPIHPRIAAELRLDLASPDI